MSQRAIDRRGILKVGGLASAGVLMAAPAGAAAGTETAAVAKPFEAQPLPLPFDPKTIVGLSEKLLVSHHTDNYGGAVKRLSAIQAEFARLDPATAPGFVINGLKREELLAWNSMILHELYFAGLGAGNRPGMVLAAAIERDFGSDARWRAEFVAMGKALGGGSGWVLLTYNRQCRPVEFSQRSCGTFIDMGDEPWRSIECQVIAAVLLGEGAIGHFRK